MNPFVAVVLAAGKGTRLKSKVAKPVHEICGRPMIQWVYDALVEAGIREIAVVISSYTLAVRDVLQDRVTYILQEEQLGTGHALKTAHEFLKQYNGRSMISICADIPTVTAKNLLKLMHVHEREKNTVTVLTTFMDTTEGYGRILRQQNGEINRIVQHVDAMPDEREVNEVDAGIYCFRIAEFLHHVDQLQRDNNQLEYYQTDLIKIMNEQGLKVNSCAADKPENVMCVNDQRQCVEVERYMIRRMQGLVK